MEFSWNYKPERIRSVIVEDLKKDLSIELSKIPTFQDRVVLEKENLQVYLRIRPFTSTENNNEESQEYMSIEPPDTVVLKAPRFSLTARQSEKFGPQVAQRFQFSKVYGPETTQRQIFDGTTKALVKDVLGGGNSLVFTYGVTNAGKTFTFLGPESDGGILPRALNVIFNSIEGRVHTQHNLKPYRCVDFTRLTKDQQEEEVKIKRNLLKRFKEIDMQKSSSSSMSDSASNTLLDGFSYSDMDGDSICLEEASHVKFSVWVSFCEIYNESIHDLLDTSNNSQRRNVLRLCQDVKGNTFVKDITWVQVNSAEEAYRILKIGRKNQSFSSTKLNSLSSRSHSIFSIRILKIEDMGVPRVQSISELSLCDLAGSERCAKTQNRGDRLKEAGNINTSLLTLGKCMNALRLSQSQSKFQQHIPFRESKLTHYLQGFFSGRGKACMIVNVNQCSAMFDETLNVLKFSALAQKVVVLNPKPVFTAVTKRPARDVSMIINNVDRRQMTRRSTLIGWETSLEDVQEDKDAEDMDEDDDYEEEEEESMMDNTVLEALDEQEFIKLRQKIIELENELSRGQSEKLAMEALIRDEVTTEFMELFANMEKDYNKRLQREKEIAEERADRRMELLKNLAKETTSDVKNTTFTEDSPKESKREVWGNMMKVMQNDLAGIKKDAQAAKLCLEKDSSSTEVVNKLKAQLNEITEELFNKNQHLSFNTKEMETIQMLLQKTNEKLFEAEKFQNLMTICQEKDEMISKLQISLDQNVKEAYEQRSLIDSIKEEVQLYRNNCKCQSANGDKTTEELEKKHMQTLKEKDECLELFKYERKKLDKRLKDLAQELSKQIHFREAAVLSFEAEKAANVKFSVENQELSSALDEVQQAASEMRSKLLDMEAEVNIHRSQDEKMSMELQSAQARIRKQEEEAIELYKMIKSLEQESLTLQEKLKSQKLLQGEEKNCAFEKTIDSLRKECEMMVTTSLEKSRTILSLEHEVSDIKEEITKKQDICIKLQQERDSQTEEFQTLQSHHQALMLSEEHFKKTCSELNAELDAVRTDLKVFKQSSERVSELEKQLAEKVVHCSDLEQRLQEAQNTLDQVQEHLKKEQCQRKEEEKKTGEIFRASEQSEKDRKELESELSEMSAQLKAKTQELKESKKQVDDCLVTIKGLKIDLDIKEKNISDLQATLTKASAETTQLKEDIVTLTGEIKMLQQKLTDAERDLDQPPNLMPKSESTDELKDPSGLTITQQNQDTSKVLLEKDSLIEEMRLIISDKEQSHSSQKQLLETQLNEIKSLTEELMLLKEKKQNNHVTNPGHCDLHQDEAKTEKDTGYLTMSAQDSSVLSTDSDRDKRFPKPQLEISFTPLKPDCLNLRRPGEEESVTIKIKRTARKRKSPENSVASENKANKRPRGNIRTNIQCAQSPAGLGKNANQFNQQDSSVSSKNKKDGTLQRIGDLIQNSPTIFGSKAKKIMAKVIVQSPDTQNIKEINNKPKRSKRKLFKTHISSPLDIPNHPIIEIAQEDKESDHLIIKRNLRTRTGKKN